MNQKDSHKNKPVTYYRIESMDRYSGETFSGFMAAVYSSLALILDMRPDELDIVDLIWVSKKSNHKAYELYTLSLELVKDLPILDFYKADTYNYICLYRKKEYESINEIVMETTHNIMMLILKKMNLKDNELVYKDSYQVVIDRNTYLKHNDNKRFELFD